MRLTGAPAGRILRGMNSNPADMLREQIERLPTDPGVYLFQDGNGKVLYVGKARSLRVRARNYLRDGADGRYHIQFLLRRAATIDCIVTGTEQEALILASRKIPDEYLEKLEEVEIAVRPF